MRCIGVPSLCNGQAISQWFNASDFIVLVFLVLLIIYRLYALNKDLDYVIWIME